MLKPDVGISYTSGIPTDAIQEFGASIEREGLVTRYEEREEDGPYAQIEWLIPTAVVVFLGRSYFDAFLKEAGKDHYQLLRSALKKLSKRFIGPNAPRRVRVVFSKGKATSEDPKYSLLYSVVADLGDGIRIKLLLPPDCGADECDAAINAFTTFLDQIFSGTLDSSSVKGLVGARPISGMLLVSYNSQDRVLEVLYPMPARSTWPE